MDQIVGADLALRHGAIVSASGEIIHIYQSPDGMNSTLESIHQRARNAALSLPKYCTVVIDFDRTQAQWERSNGKNKRKSSNSAVGTLLMLMGWGFACIAREVRQAQIQFVAPSKVRVALGLEPHSSKSEVHKATAHLRPDTIRGTKFHKDFDVRGDCVDAWLLAFTLPSTRLR